MIRFLYIAIGAALGANARYLVGIWAAGRFGTDFPYGTLVVNVTGSFLLGFIVIVTTERLSISPESRLLLGVGLLGSYTTFSSYTFEGLMLLREGGWLPGLLYIVGNNLLGIIFAAIGVFIAQLISR